MESNSTKLQEDDMITIDLGELIRVLLHRWWVIILTMIVAGGVTFGYFSFLVTPQYASTAKLYVLSKSTSLTNLANIQAFNSLTSDYMTLVSSRPIYDSVQKELKLDYDYDKFTTKVTVNNPSDTRILEITGTDPDPKEAKRLADTTAEVAAKFISVKMDQEEPNLIQKGYIDQKPVSPSVGKNTVIGALIGLLASSAVIIVRYLMNDKVEVPDDLEKIGLNVLGSLPYEDNDSSRRNGKKKGKGGKKA